MRMTRAIHKRFGAVDVEEHAAHSFETFWMLVRGDGDQIMSDDRRLRVEMRGVLEDAIQVKSLEMPVEKSGWFRTWSWVVLRGADYKSFGELAAWRVTLWDGERQVSEQKSFLW